MTINRFNSLSGFLFSTCVIFGFFSYLSILVVCLSVSRFNACTGLGNSSAVGPVMVEKLATAFLDAMYKA